MAQSIQQSASNPLQYMDLFMTKFMMDQMSNITGRNGGQLTISNICKMLAVMSLDEIRKLIFSGIKKLLDLIGIHNWKIIQWINDNIINNFVIRSIKYVINKILNIFNYNTPNRYIHDIIPMNDIIYDNYKNNNYIAVNLKYTISFMQILINYIINNKECSYRKSYDKQIEIINLEKTNITEIWYMFDIKYKDIIITSSLPIQLIFEKHLDKISLKTINNISNTINIKYFSDLLPNCTLTTLIKDCARKFCTYQCKDENDFVFTLKDIGCTEFLVIKYFEIYSIQILKKKFPDLDFAISVYEYIIYLNFLAYNKYYIQNSSNKNSYYKIINPITIYSEYSEIYYYNKIICIDPKIKDLSQYGTYSHQIQSKFGQPLLSLYIYNLYKTNADKFREINMNITNDLNNIYMPQLVTFISFENTKELNILNINISSEKSISILNEQFDEFISYISAHTEIDNSKLDKKVKIYNVKLHRTEKYDIEPNPEYESYIEYIAQIKEIMSNISSNKEEKNQSMFPLNMSNISTIGSPPSKTLKKITYEKNIIVDLMNEKYKDLNTLYLRQNDMKRLKSTLEYFHKKKEWMAEFGIPNKLAVLLYGEPGTGKTSTIWAIASYLGKDIYYVNLKSIKTNDELQMIFDHVNKNCVNGGIIVFEDIDAASSVVHQRHTSDIGIHLENTACELYDSKSDVLTLDYFLNLLQGTLTQDGTICIATTNHFEKLDKAFVRDGRFDVKIEMKKCDHYQFQNIYKKFIKKDIPTDLLNRIKENEYTPATVIFRVKDYVADEYSDEEILQTFLSV